jgi:hypothetical protein
MHILDNRQEYGPMHNTMELLKLINKTKFLIPYEQLYIQSHHHHKQLILEQNSGEYNPMNQVVYDQQVMPHATKPSPINRSSHNLQPTNGYKCTQLTPKTACIVPPEDGSLMPKTCRGLRHNKVIVKVEVY